MICWGRCEFFFQKKKKKESDFFPNIDIVVKLWAESIAGAVDDLLG